MVPEVVTAGFVYERLRKPAYSDEDLAAIAARSRRFLAAGLDVLPRLQARRDRRGRARSGVAAARRPERLRTGRRGDGAVAAPTRRVLGFELGPHRASVTQAISPETRITPPATTSEMERPVRKAP